MRINREVSHLGIAAGIVLTLWLAVAPEATAHGSHVKSGHQHGARSGHGHGGHQNHFDGTSDDDSEDCYPRLTSDPEQSFYGETFCPAW